MVNIKTKGLAIPAKKVSKKEKKSAVQRLTGYLHDVRVEFKKVNWPSRSDLSTATLVVLAALLFFSVYLGLLDLIFAKIIEVFIR